MVNFSVPISKRLLSITAFILLTFQATQMFASNEIDFEELVEIADRYDLPQPDASSQLVVGWGGSWRSIGKANSVDAGIYRPAFVIENTTDEETVVRMGFAKVVCKSKKTIPSTRPFTLESPDENKDGFTIEHRHISNFETSVQLARMGKTELAKKLWNKLSTSDFIFGDHPHEGLLELSEQPKLLLARGIFEYNKDLALEPESDWNNILEKLERLRDEFPELFSDDPKDYNESYRNRFVDDLKITVDSEQPKPNTVEGLLVRYGAGQASREMVDDPNVVEIFNQGLKAIEPLVQLTTDHRLTCHVRPQMNNGREYRLRVGDLASRVLEQMAGANVPQRMSQNLDDQGWHDWLAETDLSNEVEFFVEAAIDEEAGRACSGPIIILRNRHPGAFVELIEKVSNHGKPISYCHYFTHAIRDSSLADEEKVRLLILLIERFPKEQKRFAAQALAKIDKEITAAFVMPLIEELPQDVDEPYWTSEVANYTHVVMLLDDVNVWKAYLAKAKQASTGLRMEMMNPFNYSYIGKRNLELRLAFLAEFLDDETIRKTATDSEKFSGPCAAFTFKEISVRDFVAMQLSSLILEKRERPNGAWTAEQWTELRKQVRNQLSSFELPNLAPVDP